MLGVGLAMLEKAFLAESQETPNEKGAQARSGKRRKVEVAPTPMMPLDPFDDDDDDDDNIYPPVVQGKKAKLGVGYAGDIREDVSCAHLIELRPLSIYGDRRQDNSRL